MFIGIDYREGVCVLLMVSRMETFLGLTFVHASRCLDLVD